MTIKELLIYQEKDKERIKLVMGVEQGRVKRELDTSSATIDSARNALLSLENDAKALMAAFESTTKNLTELVDRITQFKATAAKNQTEDEIESAQKYLATIQSKISGYENQLDDISKRIARKTAEFEDAKTAVVRAQNNKKALEPQYEAQKKQIEAQLSSLDAELKKLGSSVDATLLERYKSRRKSDKTGKIPDIAVALLGDKCHCDIWNLARFIALSTRFISLK